MNSTTRALQNTRGLRVFIVEDSAAIRERLLEIVAEVDGTEVVGEAANFVDAVRGILATSPDVAILDVRLADDQGSGIDVLRFVKAQLPALKAIVMSNFATPQHMQASAEAGARFFLDKTIEFERIDPILREFHAEQIRVTTPKA